MTFTHGNLKVAFTLYTKYCTVSHSPLDVRHSPTLPYFSEVAAIRRRYLAFGNTADWPTFSKVTPIQSVGIAKNMDPRLYRHFG